MVPSGTESHLKFVFQSIATLCTALPVTIQTINQLSWNTERYTNQQQILSIHETNAKENLKLFILFNTATQDSIVRSLHKAETDRNAKDQL